MALFEHDCGSCQYLGEHDGADLYVCRGTLVARFSSDPPDYASGTVFATSTGNPFLYEARRRADAMGIKFYRHDSQ